MKTILQFGEGNFLRAFAEDYLQSAVENGYNGKAVICQPRKNTKVINALKAQNCEYTVIKSGLLGGNVINEIRKITCVAECIDSVGEYEKLCALFESDGLSLVISNTTEAGIAFNENDSQDDIFNAQFPAKLCVLLYKRYLAGKNGLVFLPVELIENNGYELKKCILKYAELFALPSDFSDYVNKKCSFCNTLVDRIVTGHQSGSNDPCSVSCEPYKSFIIEADERAKGVIPFSGVTYTDDLSPYRTRKVRILNGVHTMSVLAGYMAGFDIVRDMVNDELFYAYIEKGLSEIKPTIGLDCEDFAASVIERFKNPFIDHKLLDISLNSVSKFRVRCLDTILDYYSSFNALPETLVFSLAALFAFYLKVGNREYELRDNEDVLSFFESNPSVNDILKNTAFWGRDLTEINGLSELCSADFELIKTKGITSAIREIISE